MRCDVIAEGIIAAAKELDMKTPIVVRLQVWLLCRSRFHLSSLIFCYNFHSSASSFHSAYQFPLFLTENMTISFYNSFAGHKRQ